MDRPLRSCRGSDPVGLEPVRAELRDRAHRSGSKPSRRSTVAG